MPPTIQTRDFLMGVLSASSSLWPIPFADDLLDRQIGKTIVREELERGEPQVSLDELRPLYSVRDPDEGVVKSLIATIATYPVRRIRRLLRLLTQAPRSLFRPFLLRLTIDVALEGGGLDGLDRKGAARLVRRVFEDTLAEIDHGLLLAASAQLAQVVRRSLSHGRDHGLEDDSVADKESITAVDELTTRFRRELEDRLGIAAPPRPEDIWGTVMPFDPAAA